MDSFKILYREPYQKHFHTFLGMLTVHTYNLELVSMSESIMKLYVASHQQYNLRM